MKRMCKVILELCLTILLSIELLACGHVEGDSGSEMEEEQIYNPVPTIVAPAIPIGGGEIDLSSSFASQSCPGATLESNTITVTSPGRYCFSGASGNCSIRISCDGDVVLCFSDVFITSRSTPAILVIEAGSLEIESEGNRNQIGSVMESNSNEREFAITCSCDLLFSGIAPITISAEGCAGISCDRFSAECPLIIDSEKRGVECVCADFNQISFSMSSGGKGVVCDRDITFSGCFVDIVSYGDSLSGENIFLDDGDYSFESERGRGIDAALSAVISADCILKTLNDGIKAGEGITVNCESLNIVSGENGIQVGKKGNNCGRFEILNGDVMISAYKAPLNIRGEFLVTAGSLIGTGITDEELYPSEKSRCLGVFVKREADAGVPVEVLFNRTPLASFESAYPFTAIIYSSETVTKNLTYSFKVGEITVFGKA